ncbi:hypothetical protein B0H13DRAFT_2006085 [Mycena leptocephala]|nr:hypothetical protein B0H13DRAFT_2006085 [Mycena leptocephala]
MCVSSFFCVIFFIFSPLCPCFSLLSSRGLAVHPICNNVVLSATTVGDGGRRWRISVSLQDRALCHTYTTLVLCCSVLLCLHHPALSLARTYSHPPAMSFAFFSLHLSRFPMSYDTGWLVHCICIVHELESGVSFVGGWTRDVGTQRCVRRWASSAVRDARRILLEFRL